MKTPKAMGALPAGIVALTAFVTVSITDTAVEPEFAT
jgi:hypothetical protein